MTEFRSIPEYPQYKVSSEGTIIAPSGMTLKPKMAKTGYMEIMLRNGKGKKSLLIHRLVASAFVSNPDGKSEVNHKDGDRINNTAINLEWCTRDENLKHAFESGLTPFDTSSKGVVCWKEQEPDKKLYFHSIYRAARELRISQGNICMVCQRHRPLASGYVFKYVS